MPRARKSRFIWSEESRKWEMDYITISPYSSIVNRTTVERLAEIPITPAAPMLVNQRTIVVSSDVRRRAAPEPACRRLAPIGFS
jgi:hypothetical protein